MTAALPQGFEEIPDRPDAVGVRAGGPIIWVLLAFAVAGIGGGAIMCFVPAKESVDFDTMWPVGLVFIAIGAVAALTWFGVTRGPKYVFDDTGVHSHAVFGKLSAHWDRIEKIEPVRGGVWVTAPGGIYTGMGKPTKKKILRINTSGLRSGASRFYTYLTARARNGGRAP